MLGAVSFIEIKHRQARIINQNQPAVSNSREVGGLVRLSIDVGDSLSPGPGVTLGYD